LAAFFKTFFFGSTGSSDSSTSFVSCSLICTFLVAFFFVSVGLLWSSDSSDSAVAAATIFF